MCADRRINEENQLILRRALYCGAGLVIAMMLIWMLGLLPLYRLSQIRIYNFWGLEIERMIESSLVSAGLCAGTVLALRKPRLIPLAIVASLTIGLVAHEAAVRFASALHPDEHVIGLGEVGKLLDQFLGSQDYDLVNSFLVILLAILFCSMLSKSIRGFAGGFSTGMLIYLIQFILLFLVAPPLTNRFIVLVTSIPMSFILGAILGGSVAFGEYLAVRPPPQSRKAESLPTVIKS